MNGSLVTSRKEGDATVIEPWLNAQVEELLRIPVSGLLHPVAPIDIKKGDEITLDKRTGEIIWIMRAGECIYPVPDQESP